MELFDRYLKLVRIFLPRAQQDDIIRELSEDLHSQVEEKEAGLGRPLNKAEQRELIGQLGHPAMLAGRYGPRRQLIGPELFPFYWLVLKLSLGANVLAHVIALAATLAGGRLVNPAARLVAATGALFITFGVVTIVFALLDRYRPGGLFARRLHPSRLSTVPAGRPRGANPLSRVVTGAIFVLWWVAARRAPTLILGAGADVFKLGPVWDPVYPWIIALALIGMANACLELIRPQWSRLRLTMRLVGMCGGLAVVVHLLSSGLFVTLVDPAAQAGRLDVAIRVVNQSIYGGLWIALVIVSVLSVMELRSWGGKPGGRRPQDGAHVPALIVAVVLLGGAVAAQGTDATRREPENVYGDGAHAVITGSLACTKPLGPRCDVAEIRRRTATSGVQQLAQGQGNLIVGSPACAVPCRVARPEVRSTMFG